MCIRDSGNAEQSIVSFVRNAKSIKQKVYVISNFTPIPRENFRVGVDSAQTLTLALNTDDEAFWGSGMPVIAEANPQKTPWNDREYSVELTIPPLATIFYVVNE